MGIAFLDRGDTSPLAYHALPGDAPTLLFLGGFRSDMSGTKAVFLEDRCRAAGRAFLRFDYRGHGASGGDFDTLVLSDWLDDVLRVIDRLTEGPLVLTGSSMGSWLALRAAQMRPHRVRGVIGIAAAPDFTRWMRAAMTPAQAARMDADGFVEVPSGCDPKPYRITRRLLEDGENHCLLDRPLALDCPVRLLQGQKDPDVPWQTALRIKDALGGKADIVFIPDGDHRLSRPGDLDRLWMTAAGLFDLTAGPAAAASFAAKP